MTLGVRGTPLPKAEATTEPTGHYRFDSVYAEQLTVYKKAFESISGEKKADAHTYHIAI